MLYFISNSNNKTIQTGMYSENKMKNNFSFYITLNNKKFNIIVYYNIHTIYSLNIEMDKKLLNNTFKENMKEKSFRIQECEMLLNQICT